MNKLTKQEKIKPEALYANFLYKELEGFTPAIKHFSKSQKDFLLGCLRGAYIRGKLSGLEFGIKNERI